jgi:hypothetical protein
MPPVSQILRQTREKLGISLEEVAQRTYIKLPYLVALEEGDVGKLPAQVYIHGYIRQYAKLLELNGSDLVLQYQQDTSLRTARATGYETRTLPVPAMVGATSNENLASLPGFVTGPSASMLTRALQQDGSTGGQPPHGERPDHQVGLSGAEVTVTSPVSHSRPIDLPMPRPVEVASRIPAARAIQPESTSSSDPGEKTDTAFRQNSREVELPVVAAAPSPGSALESLAARKTADQIIKEAERDASEFRKSAEQYADQVLGQLADEIGKTLQIVRNGRAFLQSRRRRQAEHA